jgi:hypothetical protein
MQRSPIIIAALLVLACLAWALALGFSSGPFVPSSATLLAIDLLILGTVIAVGVVLSGGRWTRRAGLILLVGLAVLAIFLDVDGWWIAGAVTTVPAIGLWAGPWLGTRFRKLPRADGPPPRAAVLTLGLIAVPALVAVTAPAGVSTGGWVLSAFSLVAAWAYSRAWLTALWAIRTALPILGIVTAAGLTWPGGLALGLGVVMLTALAWAPEVQQAAMEPAPLPADPLPIPRELIPREVLDTAGLDEKGRPQPPENGT